MKYNNKAIVKTWCKDCGLGVIHTHPEGESAKIFQKLYSDVLVEIYYEFPSAHYLVILKTEPERMFLTCSVPFEKLITGKERGRILVWAYGTP